MFGPGRPFQAGFLEPGAYLRVEHLKGASLRQALLSVTNIALDWKGLPVTNTLASYESL